MADDVRPRAIVHHFRDQLEYSATLSDEPAWVEFYQRLWPDLVAAVRLDQNGQGQRDGLDRVVHLPSGRCFTIDEKKRAKDYGDVLLEDWSVWYGDRDPRNKIGWALDNHKRCDFVAYAIPSSGKCYFMPFEILRLAFVANRADWERLPSPNGRRPDVKNVGYVTRNIAVPWPTLRMALVQQMNRRFSGSLPLPIPTVNGAQLEFGWI